VILNTDLFDGEFGTPARLDLDDGIRLTYADITKGT
jgi:hypothetical protein